jgi:hypothetical protein
MRQLKWAITFGEVGEVGESNGPHAGDRARGAAGSRRISLFVENRQQIEAVA